MHLGDLKNGRSETQNQPFAEVHDDILFLILEKLEWIDRIRASRVCKKWLQQMTKIPYQGEFPWLLRHKIIDRAGCQVKLTDESSKRSYVIESGERLYGATVCASKFGWILMMAHERKLFIFFLYCPFTCKLVKLPTLNSDAHPEDCTFSSNPTLPDCVFFALFYYSESQRIEIRTCRVGDKEWKIFEIKLSIPYVRISDECVNGLLYVVLLRANAPNVYSEPILNSHVGTFDVQTQEWKLIKNEKGFLESNGIKVEPRPVWEQDLFPVVYNNKELYLVRWIGEIDAWDVFKYDMEEKQWVEQPSLGNRVLFIACDGSSYLVDAVGKLSNVANYAFFGFRGSPSYYYPFSFSTRKIEYHHKFYVDDRNFEDSTCYERAWIIPTI
ncbi:F-box/kelch-repeat protein At1g57790-like [Euphorbia lathyris]|uniref:F-box/kelch-repeat protein At1g57790-like n=1 Tax=Euphorbia lathyris TaxID=212925 RepID=UPI0033131241